MRHSKKKNRRKGTKAARRNRDSFYDTQDYVPANPMGMNSSLQLNSPALQLKTKKRPPKSSSKKKWIDPYTMTYSAALQRHKANVAFVKKSLKKMSTSTNKIEANTAALLFPNSKRNPHVLVSVLSKTHDTYMRPPYHFVTDGVAYFGGNTSLPDANATYEKSMTSKKNITFEGENILGSVVGNVLQIYSPKSKGQSELIGTLIHEAQHYADHHEAQLDKKKSAYVASQAWINYQTEFRSYWAEGSGKKMVGTAPAPWKTQRQKAIFDQINDPKYYPSFTYNYKKNKSVNGKPFKDLVHSYAKPVGINLLNSPRINNLYLALRKYSGWKKNAFRLSVEPLVSLLKAAKGLDGSDRKHVNSGAAKPLQRLILTTLTSRALLLRLAKAMNAGSKPTWIK